jgi:anthranilate synthase component 1
MIFSHVRTQPGEVTSISLVTQYVADPLTLFAKVAEQSQNCLLFESAEIDSKANLQSMMMIDEALKITCQGHKVTIDAKSNNGLSVLSYLSEQLGQYLSHASEERIEITFVHPDPLLDENSRLLHKNAFEVLRTIINQIKSNSDEPFSLFLGGVIAYDMIGNFEDLPEVVDVDNSCPDYVFYLGETLLSIDHQNNTARLIGNVFSGSDAMANCFEVGKRLEQLSQLIASCEAQLPQQDQYNTSPLTDQDKSTVGIDITDEQFCQSVLNLKQQIIDGDIFQVVPSRSFSVPCTDSLLAYQHLKRSNPSPYMFYMKDEDFVLFGASPESSLKYSKKTNQVEVYPIAGTRPRGFNPDGSINHDLDSRIELDLRSDAKENAEHIMLVDLARNDVARIAKPGSRHTTELLKVDRYSHVMHLVSKVVGQLQTDLDALHAYQACMNMGTLTGAPKIRATELIRQIEQKRRGSYGGAVGYLNGNGDMDTCIVIRAAFVKGGIARVQAGAGVVFDSDPQAEADETRAKAQAVISAIIRANKQAATTKENAHD